jgi:signal transduction histidine kinase
MPMPRTTRTTLERRGRLIFGAFLLLTVVACLAWPYLQLGSLARWGDLDRARALVRDYVWTFHVADAKRTEQLRDVLLKGGEKLKRTRVPPAPPKQQTVPPGLPPPEAEAVRLFIERPEEGQRFREENGRLLYSQAFRAVGPCRDCHGSAYPDGAIIGVVSLELDVSQRNTMLLVNRLVMVVAVVLVVAVSMAVFYAVFRYMVVRPIQHLKDVTDRVREGDLRVRSVIDTGNELQDLSDAMNRMLDQMLQVQTELRHATEVRDAKLDELAKANVALFEANQVKNKFLATMSHELHTPLNSILGFAHLLSESGAVAGDPKLARYVHNIQSSGRMLLEMINDLLDLAKIEAGRVQVRCERASPQAIVEAAVSMVRPMIGEKPLALSAEVDPATPVMVTDSTKVQQVLYNLLSNAVKFTEEGEVRVRVGPADDRRVAFVVADTGPGIAREQQLRIFERFVQLDSSYTRRHGGTGLGLSIVKELTGLLGGEVSVESEPGRGSTFTVLLPADSSPAHGRTAEDADAHAAPAAAPGAPGPPTAPDTNQGSR